MTSDTMTRRSIRLVPRLRGRRCQTDVPSLRAALGPGGFEPVTCGIGIAGPVLAHNLLRQDIDKPALTVLDRGQPAGQRRDQAGEVLMKLPGLK
jgi:hypothetical protein